MLESDGSGLWLPHTQAVLTDNNARSFSAPAFECSFWGLHPVKDARAESGWQAEQGQLQEGVLAGMLSQAHVQAARMLDAHAKLAAASAPAPLQDIVLFQVMSTGRPRWAAAEAWQHLHSAAQLVRCGTMCRQAS